MIFINYKVINHNNHDLNHIINTIINNINNNQKIVIYGYNPQIKDRIPFINLANKSGIPLRIFLVY